MKNEIKFITCLLLLGLILCRTDSKIFIGEDQDAGLIPLDNGDDMFYLLYNSRRDPDSDPLILWLTGGPGCAGQAPAFMQTGPFFVEADLTLKKNNDSWNNFSNMIFVDQPVGTGFSKAASQSSYSVDLTQVAINIHKFLVKFLDKYPKFKQRPLYIHGDSYSGHFVPAIGSYIVKNPNPNINLKGVSIGNGYVEPVTQLPAIPDHLKSYNMLNEIEYAHLKGQMGICQALMNSLIYPLQTKDFCLLSIYLGLVGLPNAKYNLFDFTKPCCYDFDRYRRFSDLPDVKAEWGVSDREAEGCDPNIPNIMAKDHSISSRPMVEDLINSNVKVLIYSGEHDIISNPLGQEAWTAKLQWTGASDLKAKPYSNYKNGAEYKRVGNVTLMKIFNAGHIAAMDQPELMADVYQQFIANVF